MNTRGELVSRHGSTGESDRRIAFVTGRRSSGWLIGDAVYPRSRSHQLVRLAFAESPARDRPHTLYLHPLVTVARFGILRRLSANRPETKESDYRAAGTNWRRDEKLGGTRKSRPMNSE